MDLEYNSGVLFIRLNGKLINKNVYKINNYLIPVLLKHKIKYSVLNLEKLNCMDLIGLNALLKIKWAIKLNKGKLILTNVNDTVKNECKELKIKIVKDEIDAQKLIEV